MKKVKIKHYTESIHYDIEQLARVMKLGATQTFNKLKIELSPEEYSTLDVISCHSGICQRDLAKLIFKDRANTGKILTSLEEKGCITRFVDTKNNRLVRKMAITEKGYKVLINTNKALEGHIEQVLDKIPLVDMEQLQNSLKLLRTNIEKILELNI